MKEYVVRNRKDFETDLDYLRHLIALFKQTNKFKETVGKALWNFVFSEFGKRCLFCARDIHPEAMVCPYCGSHQRELYEELID